jgi:glucose-6-phosphate 1-epimerase
MAQTVAELNEHFGMAGVLAFREEHGLIFADITAPTAKASVCLQGAHVVDWQPKGQEKVLFLSQKSDLAPVKAIRGGIPVLFPWFGPRHDGKEGPMHGFARVEPWTLEFAALAGDDLHMTFTLGPTQMSRELGFDHFRVAYQVSFGKALKLQLTVANDGTEPLVFEEGLHTYFHVKDVHEITLAGLDGTQYKDKVDGFKVKPQVAGPMRITGPTDRVYMDTTATCTITDPGFKRVITVEKAGSETTVVWNPWKEMPDIQVDGWHEFMCCETVNAAEQTVTLAQGKAHAMEAHISITAI